MHVAFHKTFSNTSKFIICMDSKDSTKPHINIYGGI